VMNVRMNSTPTARAVFRIESNVVSLTKRPDRDCRAQIACVPQALPSTVGRSACWVTLARISHRVVKPGRLTFTRGLTRAHTAPTLAA
jgi:hypothetical protein